MGEVGLLPVELGVEAVDVACRELVHEGLESGRVADPAVVADAGRARHDGARADPPDLRSQAGSSGFGARAIASLRAPKAGARGPSRLRSLMSSSPSRSLAPVAHSGVLHAEDRSVLGAAAKPGVDDLADKKRVGADDRACGAARSQDSRSRAPGSAPR